MTLKVDPNKQKQQSELDQAKQGLRLVKSTLQVGSSLKGGLSAQTAEKILAAGLKMASDKNPFLDELVNPIKLAQALKQEFGIAVLGWGPETLAAELDRKVNGWSAEKIADALLHFHNTGAIKSGIPLLVREKIHAIRVVATSNSAQTEWHIFEKVGGAFNDRVAKFGVVEPLTAGECAKTIAVIENIRPDTYTNEIKIYIAAVCHEGGFITIAPIKWLNMSESYLQQFNRDATGELVDPTLKARIEMKLAEFRSNDRVLNEVEDDIASIQAAKLLGVEAMADEVIG